MANRKRLTAAAVDRLKPPTDKAQVDIFDDLVRGFAIRVSKTGAKSYVVFYRFGGKVCRLTLGRHPMLSLGEAREKARAALNQVELGHDPRIQKAEQKRRLKNTVGTVAEDFLEKYAKRNQRSWRVTEQILRRDVIPIWGDRPIETISRADALDMLDGIMAEGKDYKANRVLGHVRKLMNWAIERGLIAASPVANVRAPGKETSRDRVLTYDEIVKVWGACDGLGYPFGGFTRLLLVTGQRRDEVARMKWSDLDLDNRLWTLPREQTKSDRAHEVPLSDLAIEILEGLPRVGEHIFTSGRRGDKPVSGFSVAKRRLDKASGVNGWRLHDLRRTCASGMARLNIAPHVVEKVLNHSTGTFSGVAGVYNRYGYLDEKRDALEIWARKIEALIRETPDNAVTLEVQQ